MEHIRKTDTTESSNFPLKRQQVSSKEPFSHSAIDRIVMLIIMIMGSVIFTVCAFNIFPISLSRGEHINANWLAALCGGFFAVIIVWWRVKL